MPKQIFEKSQDQQQNQIEEKNTYWIGLRYPKVVIKMQKKNHWFNCEKNMYRRKKKKKKKEAPPCCIIGSTGHVNRKMLSLKASHTISDFLCIDD